VNGQPREESPGEYRTLCNDAASVDVAQTPDMLFKSKGLSWAYIVDNVAMPDHARRSMPSDYVQRDKGEK
jgi:hypothetical protein